MPKKAKLLWVDLEMTGLDPKEDRILEVAAILTDWNFKELAVYQSAVKVSNKSIEKRMFDGPGLEFWESVLSVREQLVSQNKSANKKARAVEQEILAFIDEYFDKDDKIILAGNSIHQDRKFILNEWPELDKRLHYRMLDVSAWKVVMEGKYRKKFTKPEAHRALEDIRGSIEELQYYLGKVKV